MPRMLIAYIPPCFVLNFPLPLKKKDKHAYYRKNSLRGGTPTHR